MSNEGDLTIGTTVVELGDAHSHPDARPGRYVKLTVTDTGTGMDDDTTTRVFEPFFTTKEPGQGVGLGLAMAHGVVKQSGGFISVESRPNAGSTFTVYLPETTHATAHVDEPSRGHPGFEADTGAINRT